MVLQFGWYFRLAYGCVVLMLLLPFASFAVVCSSPLLSVVDCILATLRSIDDGRCYKFGVAFALSGLGASC